MARAVRSRAAWTLSSGRSGRSTSMSSYRRMRQCLLPMGMPRCTHGNAVPVGAERTREYYQGGTDHVPGSHDSTRRDSDSRSNRSCADPSGTYDCGGKAPNRPNDHARGDSVRLRSGSHLSNPGYLSNPGHYRTEAINGSFLSAARRRSGPCRVRPHPVAHRHRRDRCPALHGRQHQDHPEHHRRGPLTRPRPIGWTGAHIARPASPGTRSVAIDVERRKPEVGDAPSPTEPLEARRIRAAIARRLFDALAPRADRRTLQVNGGRFCCRPEVTKEDKVWPSTP